MWTLIFTFTAGVIVGWAVCSLMMINKFSALEDEITRLEIELIDKEELKKQAA